jgi:hypothetical protein
MGAAPSIVDERAAVKQYFIDQSSALRSSSADRADGLERGTHQHVILMDLDRGNRPAEGRLAGFTGF